jgi:hypothetical protein
MLIGFLYNFIFIRTKRPKLMLQHFLTLFALGMYTYLHVPFPCVRVMLVTIQSRLVSKNVKLRTRETIIEQLGI